MARGSMFGGWARAERPMMLYLAVAFGWAWAFWLAAWLVFEKRLDLPLVPVLMIGSFGPLLGAAVTTLAEGGPRRTLMFFARVFELRMGWAVFLVAFFLAPITAVAVEFAHAAISHAPPHIDVDLRDLPMTYLFLFVLGGTLAEEFGWSLLSDKLDAMLPLGRSTFALGTVWALWHLPLFFIMAPGMVQGYTPFYVFFFVTVSMRYLFAWAYHRGGYNILSNMLFHTASNLAYSIVVLAPDAAMHSSAKLWMYGVLTLLSAGMLWWLAPPRPRFSPLEARA